MNEEDKKSILTKRMIIVCNYVLDQVKAGFPENTIRENLAYMVEEQFGLDMMASLEFTEKFFKSGLYTNIKKAV